MAEDKIEDIIDEITQLQGEMAEASAPKAEPESVIAEALTASDEPADDAGEGVEEFRGGWGDASMEESLEGIRAEESPSSSILEDEAEVVKLVEAAADELAAVDSNKESKMSDTPNPSEGSLTMTLSGSMTLKLKYEFDGQEVAVSFNDGYLKVALADGTEFKIPVRSSGLKAA